MIIVASLSSSSRLPSWQVYAFQDDSFTFLSSLTSCSLLPTPYPPLSSSTPSDWRVTDAILADVTHDGIPEWVLLVWRPWRDWPIQRWSSAPSPIAEFHDAGGDSCHLVLLDPRDGREIWAGSALPAPLLALEVGDVDGDGRNEVVTLEGDYLTGRDGPAARVDVWSWNGFGFTLAHRSPLGIFHQLRLTDVSGDGIPDVAVR